MRGFPWLYFVGLLAVHEGWFATAQAGRMLAASPRSYERQRIAIHKLLVLILGFGGIAMFIIGFRVGPWWMPVVSWPCAVVIDGVLSVASKSVAPFLWSTACFSRQYLTTIASISLFVLHFVTK